MTCVRKFIICESIVILGIALIGLFTYFSPIGTLLMGIFPLSYHAFRKKFYPQPSRTLPADCRPATKVYLAYISTMLICTIIALLYSTFVNLQSKIPIYMLYSLLISCIPFAIKATMQEYKIAKQKDELIN
ncbi:MAG: hypothetical protein A2Y12_20135 [Planctomycetes bacterium GWF2_42_9]|nr:MAG: hypothetical protein A2Y12_20135 [Planctomycetes bacterium GWF2_42_9]HAL45091.1 hypothetical protein [Phycisphaerales bacterium]